MLNVDMGKITIVFHRDDLKKVEGLIPTFPKDDIRSGWIEDGNPSPQSFGFFLYFRKNNEEEYAILDFHNVPFFYKDNFSEYMQKITKHVQGYRLPKTDLSHFCTHGYGALSILTEELNSMINILKTI